MIINGIETTEKVLSNPITEANPYISGVSNKSFRRGHERTTFSVELDRFVTKRKTKSSKVKNKFGKVIMKLGSYWTKN